jgi:hypothetical protein
MKNSKTAQPESLKGKGYIFGAIIGIVAAITAFVFTENIAISIPLFAALSIPLGISIEQKLQTEAEDKKPRTIKMLIALIATGVLVFASILLITKII